jgi:hypothetical protein
MAQPASALMVKIEQGQAFKSRTFRKAGFEPAGSTTLWTGCGIKAGARSSQDL